MFNFQSLISSVRAKVVDIVGAKLDGLGKAIVARARELVPVKSGQLRDSIAFYFDKDTLTVSIVVDKFYGAFVEYGTARSSAHPYIRPAIREIGKLLGVSVQAQFSTVPVKYEAKTKKYVKSLGGPRTIIGHRNRPKKWQK